MVVDFIIQYATLKRANVVVSSILDTQFVMEQCVTIMNAIARKLQMMKMKQQGTLQ